jgi:hypothetical protein
MAEANFDPERNRLEFEKFVVREYLRLGSVDEIFKVHNFDLPISYSDCHRLVARWGIVKAAGPNARLSEALAFLTELSEEKIPLEKLYRRMLPSFKTSMSTLHRILTHVRNETIRRVGTALVITPGENPNLVLVGSDVSKPRPELGKLYGSLSLPMGYSSRTETAGVSILRVLQQEVFAERVVNYDFPQDVIPKNPEPFMFLDIVDVRVAVYKLSLPKNLVRPENFSSFKLTDHRYLHSFQLIEGAGYPFRTGIKEIGLGYLEYQKSLGANQNFQTIYAKSFLNLQLAPLELYR